MHISPVTSTTNGISRNKVGGLEGLPQNIVYKEYITYNNKELGCYFEKK